MNFLEIVKELIRKESWGKHDFELKENIVDGKLKGVWVKHSLVSFSEDQWHYIDLSICKEEGLVRSLTKQALQRAWEDYDVEEDEDY